MNKEDKEDKEEQMFIPFIAVSEETTIGNPTGDLRTLIPCLSGKIAPCINACPIGQDIPVIMDLVRRGELEKAFQELGKKNPLPFSTAKVCQGFCKQHCNREEFDEFVAFNEIERFLGEMALEEGWTPITRQNFAAQNLSGQGKVAVIGSGPAGLSCAYQMSKRGYSVTIFEALPVIGGLLRVGIPANRLSKYFLKKEIRNNILEPFQIKVKTNYSVDKEKFRKIRKDFDAVFAAVGAHKPKKLHKNIEIEKDAEGIVYGLDFLKKVNLGKTLNHGGFDSLKRVVIIGDGNTAVDSARLARLLNKEVSVFCEKAKKDIPEFLQKGIKALMKQGVVFLFSRKILKINVADNKVRGVISTSVDKRGRVEIDNTKADSVIIALGEETDTSFIDKDFAPEIAGVFFGGDPNNVASAIASGNQGAEKIIAYLEQREQPNFREKKSQEIVESKDLNFAYFEHLPRNKKITDQETAIKEAERCFNCGTCIGCGVCEQFCPDVSISVSEKDKEPEIDKEHCKGCGICAQECPRAVIRMKIEEKEE
jgi:NADPH-dependent glutamate synthase beta subunit-like oxidoreductase/Pyruvate/2-oxoacid:ferredoxin oxidoreductase delta subunit